MKLNEFKTIRNKLTFWFLLLALAPLLGGILITYIQQKKVIEHETFNKLTAIRNLKVAQLENWLDQRKGDLKIASADFEIRALENIFEQETKSAEDINSIETARSLLNRYLENFNTYEEIFIVDAKTGVVEISTDKSFEGKNLSQSPSFTNPLESGGIYIEDIYYSKTLGKPQMTFSQPIYCLAHNKHIIGILVVRVDLHNSLFKLLSERVGLGETGETLIVNKDVIALNELRGYEDAVLKLKINAKPAVEAANGKTGITITKDYRGVDILAAYTHIPETGWGFVCKQDIKELNIPITEITWNLLLLIIVAGLIIILLVTWVSKSISKPIISLKNVAQKITLGDLSARSTVFSNDEIGALTIGFNKTADMLESKIKVQQGIAAISNSMLSKSSIQDFAISLLKHLMKLSNANMSAFYVLNEITMEYEHFSSVGANKEMISAFRAENPEGEFGNVLSTKKIFHLKDIPENTIFKFKTTAGDAVPKEIITIPVMVEGIIVAIISLVNINKFSTDYLETLEQSWTNLNTSYSNLIATERTSVLAENLSMINQELEAQSEELQEQSEELQNQTEELQRTSEELQEQNIELEAQRKQVETANRLKSEFLSNMSHELRTPLNSIMSLSRVLISQTQNKLDEEDINYLEIVERNGKKLLSLINDILDLSKIEAGKMEIAPKKISFTSFLQIIVENMHSISEQKGLSIKLNINNEIPFIETDESRLYQVFNNIIGNAVKFTDKGSINIEVDQVSEHVIVIVKDTGIGISGDELPYIFDEFRQADGTSSRQYEGTGLGLAIANKMIKILGGTIQVKSKLGVGSTFTISVPIKWYDESQYTNIYDIETIISENEKLKSVEETPFTNKNQFELRILMVEDNQEAIIQVKSVLEKENFNVDVATGGKEALNYVKNTIPDGIILDLMMPEIDGFEVLEKLRATKTTKNIPVLILTAKDLTQEDLKKLSSNNISQLIHKGDIDISGLLSKVKKMLGNPDLEKNYSANKPLKISKNATETPSVIIIEDNLDNLITLKALLKGKFIISEAQDGIEGIRLIRELIPDLILLDMSLPKMSGENIIELIKAQEETKNIPIIAVTALAMKGDKTRILKMGCDGYVSKPIDQNKLMTEINSILYY